MPLSHHPICRIWSVILARLHDQVTSKPFLTRPRSVPCDLLDSLAYKAPRSILTLRGAVASIVRHG